MIKYSKGQDGKKEVFFYSDGRYGKLYGCNVRVKFKDATNSCQIQVYGILKSGIEEIHIDKTIVDNDIGISNITLDALANEYVGAYVKITYIGCSILDIFISANMFRYDEEIPIAPLIHDFPFVYNQALGWLGYNKRRDGFKWIGVE